MTKKILGFFSLAVAIVAFSVFSTLGARAEDSSTCSGNLTTYYYDGDGDGYGSSTVTVLACSAPKNYVSTSTDCNDNNAKINPAATEICNGLDDDCDGVKDENCNNNAYPCAGYLFKNHGSYVSCVSHWLNELRDQQRARSQEKIKAAQEKAWERYNKRWDNFWDKMIKQMNKIKERGKIKK